MDNVPHKQPQVGRRFSSHPEYQRLSILISNKLELIGFCLQESFNACLKVA